MNNEIKMSDYFALPVLHEIYMQDEHAPVLAYDCNKVVFKGWCEPVVEFACIAINNHDRLAEENKRLREVVLYLARSRQHSEINSHYVLESLVSMASRTLSELDGEK